VKPAVRKILFGTPSIKAMLRKYGGSLYVPSVDSCFQESAGTTPCTIDSVVGKMSDLVDAKHATQATAGYKPFLRTGYINHDRVDDKLSVTLTNSTDYNLLYSTFSGCLDYTIKSPSSGATNLPAADIYAMALVPNNVLSSSDRARIRKYLLSKSDAIGSSDILRLKWYSAGAKTISPVPASGAGVIFSLTGAADQNDAFSATVAINDWVTMRSATPNLITQISMIAKGLYGQIVDLSQLTNLTLFECNGNQLTGSIPSLTANTALLTFKCDTNQLTGSIPSLTANTALTTFYCYNNQLTGSIPSLYANTALTAFYCNGNQLTGFAGGSVSATLGDFNANVNSLTQSAVDAILAAFVAANKTTGTRVLNLGGTGNATPSAAGLADKATLVTRGWTVTTN